MKTKIQLVSDNCSPAHPDVLQALSQTNTGFAPSYGADPWTLKAQELIQKAMGRNCQTLFVPSGTGSNVLGLKIACRRYQSVLCSDISHLHRQESGAVESVVGCKLLTVQNLNGKICPTSILQKLKSERAFGVSVQWGDQIAGDSTEG